MMSEIPSNISKLDKSKVDEEILRIGIIAELDAINLYEQLAAMTDNQDIKKVFKDIAREEKTHFGEFQELLLRIDGEQKTELDKGREEVREMLEE